ncbi:alpha/beta fold hydrolase [Janthinobacterium psychrotolerans]|uniref:Esterase/lipase superfamily enzyme n=1 Tax=Janthinobacterium psychrotolerans TaxID=1747903 RepID=A0A1A7BVZ2_9BURK|nr:alpha/beta fold hydrolase [Janthinobacterium psychrotolerans]OBV37736.1 Esterase/lipase superfamily enzyme [Janthinobacterium psychrotolerans]
MDLITSAISAAIAHGAPAASENIERLYQRLKAAIGRLAGAAEVLAAITSLEAEPDSPDLRLALSRALASAKAPDDMATLFAAQALLDQLPQPVAAAVAETSARVSNYAVVKVGFATDRQRNLGKPPAQRFGNERSNAGNNNAGLSYGHCEISIPRDHRMGELESPSLWRLELRSDPARHVVLLTAQVEDQATFFAGVAAQVKASAASSALIFIHGYNVSFEEAARRTGQMAYDLGFDGAPVFYSWPSQGDMARYTVDESNIEWSTPHLQAFLADFLQKTDAARVYLIGHSMGNRGLARAVAALIGDQPELARRISEIILTAPDIDAGVFRQEIAPRLTAARHPVTLYASSEDLALAASKLVHGYPRAGDSGDGMLLLAGVETIDATGVDTGFLKHSYFAEQRSALSDMFYLIHNNARADQRFLDAVDTPRGRYWTFKP